jgi:hypothetical protein
MENSFRSRARAGGSGAWHGGCLIGSVGSMSLHHHGDNIMGKYFIAWLLGVPGIVLVILYFFFH